MNSWYFSKDGQQEGPVTASQIAGLVNASALHPPTTMVWREGLADWIPLLQSPIFHEAGVPVPTGKPVIATNPYTVSPNTLAASRAARPEMPLEYPGMGRLAYIGATILSYIVFYVLFFIGILIAFKADSGVLMGLGVIFLVLFFLGAVLYIGSKRVINLGMSGWAVLWSFVPFMNFWIHWRMVACPAGYDDHKTLDTAGKVISAVWAGVILLAVISSLLAPMLAHR